MVIKGPGGFGSGRPSGDHPKTALLKTARIQRRVLETWGDLLSLNLQWKIISLRWFEKLYWVKIILIIVMIWPKGLKGLEIRGRVETIQTTVLLRSARKLRRPIESWGDLLSLKLQWETNNYNYNNNNNNLFAHHYFSFMHFSPMQIIFHHLFEP